MSPLFMLVCGLMIGFLGGAEFVYREWSQPIVFTTHLDLPAGTRIGVFR